MSIFKKIYSELVAMWKEKSLGKLIVIGIIFISIFILVCFISILLKFTGIIDAPWINFPLEYGVLSTPFLLQAIFSLIFGFVYIIILYFYDLLNYEEINNICKIFFRLNWQLLIYSLMLKAIYTEQMVALFSVIPGKGIITNLIYGIIIIFLLQVILLKLKRKN